MKVEIRTDPGITSQDASTVEPGDAMPLHEWTDPGDKDRLTVAVMDTGIHPASVENHHWFNGASLVESFDASQTAGHDAVGHGTGVASIYARYGGPVDLISVRIFGKEGRTGFETIRRGYQWLIDNSDKYDVVNLSWGAAQDVPAIDRLHRQLLGEDVIDVVAAGNTGSESGSPSTTPGAFSAGAVTTDGKITRFSSADPNQDNPDVMAAGKNVKMARAPGTSMGKVLSDQFVKASGTSFSAPITGAAALEALRAGTAAVDKSFEANAKDIPETRRDGAGILKLSSALEKDSAPTANATAWNFNGSDMLFLDAVDWLPSVDEGKAKKVEETADHVTIRVHKR